jgi:acyl carrier protein
MLIATDVRDVVHEQIQSLLTEANGSAPPLSGAENLHELGLSSLMLARLIIQLEGELGVDPFAEDAVLADVRTVQDLVAVYQEAQGTGA